MPRLFISYSRSDEAFARRLATSLSEMGADIWIDIQNIPAGMKWSSAIQQGLDVCDAMIVIISPSSAVSQNVEDEWQYYRDRGKVIVPVLLAPAQLHYQLSRLQYVNFHSQPYEVGLTLLHAELWRNNIQLRQPPNAVTMPVPRVKPQQPSYASAAPPPAAAAPRRAPQPQRRSPNLLTLGCVGLLVLGLAGGLGFFALGGLDLLTGQSTASPTAPTATLAMTATVSAEEPSLTPTLPAEVVIAAASANLRTGPGVNYPELPTFAIQGETFRVVAQARSAAGTEDWFLVQHPTLGPVWVSWVAVDLRPDGVIVPTAATIPPTPTASPPTATATPAVRQIYLPAVISFAGQIYTASFNTGSFTVVNVRVRNDFNAAIRVRLIDQFGQAVVTSTGELTAVVMPGQVYEVEVSDPANGTGNIEIVIELREG